MFCSKCGAQNDNDGTFCQECGAPISVAQPVVGAVAKGSKKKVIAIIVGFVLLASIAAAAYLSNKEGFLKEVAKKIPTLTDIVSKDGSLSRSQAKNIIKEKMFIPQSIHFVFQKDYIGTPVNGYIISPDKSYYNNGKNSLGDVLHTAPETLMKNGFLGYIGQFGLGGSATYRFENKTMQYLVDVGREGEKELILATPEDIEIQAISAPADMMGAKLSTVKYLTTYKLTPPGEVLGVKKTISSEAVFVLYDTGWQLENTD